LQRADCSDDKIVLSTAASPLSRNQHPVSLYRHVLSCYTWFFVFALPSRPYAKESYELPHSVSFKVSFIFPNSFPYFFFSEKRYHQPSFWFNRFFYMLAFPLISKDLFYWWVIWDLRQRVSLQSWQQLTFGEESLHHLPRKVLNPFLNIHLPRFDFGSSQDSQPHITIAATPRAGRFRWHFERLLVVIIGFP